MNEDVKFPDVIELNVGGKHFTTSLLTLTKCKDNMLATMFSGDYDVILDKDGRYFIDADGSHFIHILNYLRYGELPPVGVADVVYREAVYFGLQTLIEELEKFPSILGKIQRNKFRTNFSDYDDCLSAIVDKVSEGSNSIQGMSSDIYVLMYAKENKVSNENFNKFHMCIYENATGGSRTPDAKIGPWKVDSSEKEVMQCIQYDLQSQGFVVTSCHLGNCSYKCGRQKCQKLFYKITFFWWK